MCEKHAKVRNTPVYLLKSGHTVLPFQPLNKFENESTVNFDRVNLYHLFYYMINGYDAKLFFSTDDD